ncbi:MAG TPA: QacE family quaternary ammonium compound efflux SMR transporter [Gammaproteobacteria bacterium]|nr:QacE family quaternary ammonium compound efflux SMR transporter [Gammaproteobacteria bacterium]
MNKSSNQVQANKTAAPAWWLLALAICFEIAGAIGLRFSEGFTSLLPTTLALAAFAMALYLVSHVMKSLPVSVAYPVWAGGGTVGVVLLGVGLLGESINMLKVIGIALVVIGVMIVNSSSEKRSGC